MLSYLSDYPHPHGSQSQFCSDFQPDISQDLSPLPPIVLQNLALRVASKRRPDNPRNQYKLMAQQSGTCIGNEQTLSLPVIIAVAHVRWEFKDYADRARLLQLLQLGCEHALCCSSRELNFFIESNPKG